MPCSFLQGAIRCNHATGSDLLICQHALLVKLFSGLGIFLSHAKTTRTPALLFRGVYHL